jgi:hypothetical protein
MACFRSNPMAASNPGVDEYMFRNGSGLLIEIDLQ